MLQREFKSIEKWDKYIEKEQEECLGELLPIKTISYSNHHKDAFIQKIILHTPPQPLCGMIRIDNAGQCRIEPQPNKEGIEQYRAAQVVSCHNPNPNQIKVLKEYIQQLNQDLEEKEKSISCCAYIENYHCYYIFKIFCTNDTHSSALESLFKVLEKAMLFTNPFLLLDIKMEYENYAGEEQFIVDTLNTLFPTEEGVTAQEIENAIEYTTQFAQQRLGPYESFILRLCQHLQTLQISFEAIEELYQLIPESSKYFQQACRELWLLMRAQQPQPNLERMLKIASQSQDDSLIQKTISYMRGGDGRSSEKQRIDELEQQVRSQDQRIDELNQEVQRLTQQLRATSMQDRSQTRTQLFRNN